MKHLKKIVGIAFLVSIFFRVEPANAIPVPTLGAELPNQINMLMKRLEELKNVTDQIKNGIEQAKSMGDKFSLDALKGAIGKTMKVAAAGLKISNEMKRSGYSEETAKDPEKTREWVEKNMSGSSSLKTKEGRDNCLAMKAKLGGDLSATSLANGLAIQAEAASGAAIERAQEAVKNSSDQMQLIAGNTAAQMESISLQSKSMYVVSSSVASQSIDNLCN